MRATIRCEVLRKDAGAPASPEPRGSRAFLARLGCLACVTLLLGANGCVRVGRPAPERRFHLIEAAPPAHAPAEPGDPFGDTALTTHTVRVQDPRVSPRCADRGFVYRTRSGGWESDPREQFFVNPEAMVGEALRGRLEARGIFAAVLPPGSQLRGDLLLESALERLEADYAEPSAPVARVTMSFLLAREDAGGLEIVHHARYDESEPARRDDPRELVAAWSRALTRLLERLETDLLEEGKREAGNRE